MKRQRDCLFPELDESLLIWFEKKRHQNIPINGQILQVQAKKLAKEMKIENLSGKKKMKLMVIGKW